MYKFILWIAIAFLPQTWAQNNFAFFLETYADDYEPKIHDMSQNIRVKGNQPSISWNNQQGAQHIVEFFDYNCGFCRQSFPALKKLVEENLNISWDLIEYPLLSKNSLTASAFALAAHKQGVYEKVHSFLMQSKGPTGPEKLLQAAQKLRLDQKKIQFAMESPEVMEKLAQAFALANQLKVEGTPAFLIQGQVLNGSIDINEIKKLIAKPEANKRK